MVAIAVGGVGRAVGLEVLMAAVALVAEFVGGAQEPPLREPLLVVAFGAEGEGGGGGAGVLGEEGGGWGLGGKTAEHSRGGYYFPFRPLLVFAVGVADVVAGTEFGIALHEVVPGAFATEACFVALAVAARELSQQAFLLGVGVAVGAFA